MHDALPTPARERRRPRALSAALATATLAAGLWTGMSVGSTPAQAADDYPYAGMGRCPLAPLPDSYLKAKRQHERRVARQPQLVAAYEKAKAKHDKQVAARDAALAAAAEQKRQQEKDKDKGKGESGNPAPQITIPEVGPAPTPPPPVPSAPVRPERECAKNVWYVDGSMGDPWGFALRHCTSFVTWRLRETNGAGNFNNYLGGGHFSNAENWDDNARKLDYLVDDVPAVGAVAQTDDGVFGHVAWVSEVGTDTVTIEEYNHAAPGVYSTRTVPIADFRYIHVEDVAPAPSQGSDRAATSVATPGGETLSARVTEGGDLLVGGFDGRARETRLGRPGVFSELAAPTLGLDADGRVLLAAVTRDRRLVAGLLPTSRSTGRPVADADWRPRTLGTGFAPTSSPAMAVVDDRLRVVAVTERGRLRERRTSARGRWLPARTVATDGGLSVHAAPTLATDGEGAVWLVTVGRSGVISARPADAGTTTGWGRTETVGEGDWSISSTPAVSTDREGRLRVHAVTAAGDLTSVIRSEADDKAPWVVEETLSGTWSPWSSPAVDRDASGRDWLAATTSDGELMVRDMAPGEDQEWLEPRDLGAADPTSSPVMVGSRDGELRLLAATKRGEHRLARAIPGQWQGGPERSGD